MINLSLDLFKMERGVYQLNPAPVDVLKVLKNIKNEVEDTRKTKNLTIETKISDRSLGEDETFIASGEELLCYSMLANLTKNAIEASPKGECILINLEKKESAIISIHNQGALDITERKKAEQELLKHRNHLEELVKERTTELEKEIIGRSQA